MWPCRRHGRPDVVAGLLDLRCEDGGVRHWRRPASPGAWRAMRHTPVGAVLTHERPLERLTTSARIGRLVIAGAPRMYGAGARAIRRDEIDAWARRARLPTASDPGARSTNRLRRAWAKIRIAAIVYRPTADNASIDYHREDRARLPTGSRLAHGRLRSALLCEAPRRPTACSNGQRESRSVSEGPWG